MSRSRKQFSRHHLIQFVPTVKPVCLEMLPAIKAAVVGELEQPGLESTAIRLELVHCSEDIQEYPLDCFFCFAIIVEVCRGNGTLWIR